MGQGIGGMEIFCEICVEKAGSADEIRLFKIFQPITMAISRPKLWLYAKDYLIIIFGIMLYGLGFCSFIATAPDKVVIGGMAGLSQVVDMITFGLMGFHVPYSVTIFRSTS